MLVYEPEYTAKLWEIQNMNLIKQAVLVPHNEKIMEVDLNSRKIKVPEFLSVSKDHQAETIYFKFDRFYDMVDLTTTTCVIQYKNAKGEEYVYPVPFFDSKTLALEKKVLIPWCIQGPATAYAGNVEFSIRFFRIEKHDENYVITYDLNTIPSSGKVLQGQNWDLKEMDLSQFTLDESTLADVTRILNVHNDWNVYWLDV